MTILGKWMSGLHRRTAKRESCTWIERNRDFFQRFLDEKNVYSRERSLDNELRFQYPEWVIVLIAVLSVKLGTKTYDQVYEVAVEYWDQIAKNLTLEPIGQRHLESRLQRIRHHPQKPATFISQMFPELDY